MSQLHNASYFIPPTLLDTFMHYVNAERDWMKFYCDIEEDSEKYVPLATYEEKKKQELLDSINRVPHATSEAAARGTAFNDIVDTLLHGEKCGHTKMCRLYDNPNDPNRKVVGIRASANGFDFDFDINLCNNAAIYFGKQAKTIEGDVINADPSDKCLSQVLVESCIDTQYGLVNLYGFIDEMRRDMVYDIKTTSKYEFGKYAEYNQRFIYPYCLIESGMMNNVSQFEFTAYALKGGTRGQLITGTRYSEVYDYDHGTAKIYIRQICERFIEFVHAHRDMITDDKIFVWHEHKH